MTSTSQGFQFSDTLTRDEIVAVGDAFDALLRRADHKLVTKFLERMANEVAKHGVRDQEKSRDYYQGYLDAVDTLRAMPEFYRQRKDEILAEEKEATGVDREVFAMLRGGGRAIASTGEEDA